MAASQSSVELPLLLVAEPQPQPTSNDIVPLLATDSPLKPMQPPQQPVPVYDASAWALVDDATLQANSGTQFECVVAIEGTGYEQRQSVTLRKGKSSFTC